MARRSIATLTREDIISARADGKQWKVIGTLERQDGQLCAEVSPQLVAESDVFASMSGAVNAITFTTSLVGDVTLIGPGAGARATAFAILADIAAAHKGSRKP